MRDITDRKLTEAEIILLNNRLQDANYQLTTIFNTLPANIALLDDKGEIIAVNKAWKEFANENDLQTADHGLGYNYIEVCEKVTGEDARIARKMAEDMKGILQNELDEFSLEYPCHSPHVNRWFRAEVRPLTEHKDPGAVVMHFDITERKEAENEVIEMNNTLEKRVKDRTSELQEANNALEAFSYSVSHDLRAPVRAMIGFTTIIKKEYGEGFSDDLNELFEHIRISGTRMNAIIDDMLTLAKYEREKLHPAKVDMRQLFSDVWDSILFTAPHSARLVLDDLPTVEADGSMMQQVITNLLSNAVKYSSKKQAPVVHVGSEAKDSMITFSVRDNGAGFDMKGYNRLFGAFQRLHGTGDFEGTGVGLLLVKKIVERHGGTVWAEGKVDEGATFYFTLPVSV
jgi:signal transduction histidine kinase